MFFREKKTLSLGAKDTKKERTPLRALVFESRGRKSFSSRTHLVVDNSPAPNIARLCCSYYSCRLFSSKHHFCTCVHVCCARIMRFKKRRFFGLFLGKKSSKIHHHATRGKTNKVFLDQRVLAGKTTKSETMSLFSSHPSHENRVRVR